MPSLDMFRRAIQSVINLVRLSSVPKEDVFAVTAEVPEAEQYVGVEDVAGLFDHHKHKKSVKDYVELETAASFFNYEYNDDYAYEYAGLGEVADLLDPSKQKGYIGVESVYNLFNQADRDGRHNPFNPVHRAGHLANINKHNHALTVDEPFEGVSKLLDSTDGYYVCDYLESVRGSLNQLDGQMQAYRSALNADQTMGTFFKMVEAVKAGDKFKDKMNHSVKSELLNVGLMNENTDDVRSALDMLFQVPGMKHQVKFKDLPKCLDVEIAKMKAVRGFATNKDQQKAVAELVEFKLLAEGWIANVSDLRTTNMKVVDATIAFFNQATRLKNATTNVALALYAGIASVGSSAYQKMVTAFNGLKSGASQTADVLKSVMTAIGAFATSMTSATANVASFAALNKGWYAAQSDTAALLGKDAKEFRRAFWAAAMGTHMYATELNAERFTIHRKELTNVEAFKQEVAVQQQANKDVKLDEMSREDLAKVYEGRVKDLTDRKVKLEQMLINLGPKMSNTTYQACMDVRDQLKEDITAQTEALDAVLPSMFEKAADVVKAAGQYAPSMFFSKPAVARAEVVTDDLVAGPEVAVEVVEEVPVVAATTL